MNIFDILFAAIPQFLQGLLPCPGVGRIGIAALNLNFN